MSAREVADATTGSPASGATPAADRPGGLPLLGRKSVLMGMLASGFVVANAAAATTASAAGTVKPVAANQPASAAKWAPATIYARGVQVISPNNDIVSANVAHTSAATFPPDVAKWTLSSTFALAGATSGAGMAVVSPNTDGSYTKPASGTAMYLAYQSAARLPSDWAYCLSTASTLDTPSMGTVKNLGAPAGGGIETEYQGAAPIIGDDGTITCQPAAGGTHYRSEVVFQSDRTDGVNNYTNFRFVEGQRIRLAFDVMTLGLDAQVGTNWNTIFQSIGMSTGGAWPYSTISINVEPGTWVIQGGQAITRVELAPRPVHQDGVWTRWELDILLGRSGVGYVSIWKDGEQLVYQWKMTSGTFYAGTGNSSIDLAWLYFKNGLYGMATSSPIAPKVMFRNRRFSVTAIGGGSTTTWRGPQTHGPGLNLYRRNPVSDMPY